MTKNSFLSHFFFFLPEISMYAKKYKCIFHIESQFNLIRTKFWGKFKKMVQFENSQKIALG